MRNLNLRETRVVAQQSITSKNGKSRVGTSVFMTSTQTCSIRPRHREGKTQPEGI